jgi:hypothetical protein
MSSTILRILKVGYLNAEVILKNSFVPSHSHVLACHHKNHAPLLILNIMQLIDDILEDSIYAIKRKKLDI